jgi:hypothetical protein
MTICIKRTHAISCALVISLILSCIPCAALSLKGTRDFCKKHRYKVLAITSAAVVYMYTHKLIKKAIQDYKNRNNPDAKTTSAQEYAEGFSDSFIKSTKLVGTFFKVLRALTCPDNGKTSSDQWLDDFSQLA